MRHGFCLLLILSNVAWAAPPPWSGQTDYRVRLDTRFQGDRWRGYRRTPIERTDLRQRLQLDAYGLIDRPGVRMDLFVDTEVGSDLGPTPTELTVAARERVLLDLYGAELVGRAGPLTARLGRHVLVDVLGFDALDGLSIRADATPWLSVDGLAGVASRRGWSGFGPDEYARDGLAAPESSATLVGLGARAAVAEWIAFAASWRRRNGAAVEQDTAAATTHLKLLEGLELDAGAGHDLIHRRWADLWTSLRYRRSALDTSLGWRRVAPVFNADSIWWAFGPEAHQAYRGDVGLQLTRWRLRAGGEARRFEDGAGAVDWAESVELRASRALGQRGAHLGLQGRVGGGFGGQRHYADFFGRVPWFWIPGASPVWLRWRLGAVYFEDGERIAADGLSGWALVAARWAASAGVALETLVEGHINAHDPYRVRVMTQLTAESWW